MAARFQTSRAKIILLGFLLVFAQASVAPAMAASQYFSPSAGSYSANSTFAVSVYTDSSDEPASAFSALIQFPADKLKVVALSKGGSIVSLWVREPAYSNTDGTISFEGMIPNPGYLGSGGKLLTITFQALGDEAVDLTFIEGKILANDGRGTDITTLLGSAAFALPADGEAKDASALEANPTFATADSNDQPTPRVAGINSALASVFNSVSGDSSSAATDGTPSAGSELTVTQIAIVAGLAVLALLILAGLIMAQFAFLAFIHKHSRLAVQDVLHLRARRLYRVLDGLDQDIHKHLHQLEKLSRSKDLSKQAQQVVLSTSQQLVELDSQLSRSLKEL